MEHGMVIQLLGQADIPSPFNLTNQIFRVFLLILALPLPLCEKDP
jgi:hypothetical protein